MSDTTSYRLTLAAQFKRLLTILKLLDKSPGEWDVPGLAVKLNVSEATINRDIRLLRTVGKIAKQRGSGYVLEELCFIPSKLTVAEAVGLALAAQTLETQGGAALSKAAKSALHKLCGVQPEAVKAVLASLGDKVVIAPRVHYDYGARPQIMETLIEAVVNRKPVRMTYSSESSRRTATRRLDPYALHFAAGAWYVTGHCHLRKQLRTFNVSRIVELKALEGPRFDDPEDFSIGSHLERGWNVWVEDGRKDLVRLRFQRDLATYIEQTRWHPRQKTTRNRDGTVDFEVELAGTTEILPWILSFGALVEVLEPAELREQVRREAEAMTKRYARRRPGSGGP